MYPETTKLTSSPPFFLFPTVLIPCLSLFHAHPHEGSRKPMESSSSLPPPPSETDLDRLGRDLSACVLEQYVFTVVGIGLGTGLGVYRRSLLPLVAFGAVGSLGDLAYGLGWACKGKFDAYKACRNRVQPLIIPPPRVPPPLPLQSQPDTSSSSSSPPPTSLSSSSTWFRVSSSSTPPAPKVGKSRAEKD